MYSYKYLEHTSDLYIEGAGSNLSEAIESVAQGMFNSISSSCVLGTKEYVEFSENGINLQDLIINIFTRVLAEMDASSKTACNLEVLSLDESTFSSKVRITLCKSESTKLHVKAATFHGFSIIRKGGSISLRVLFDI
ncbi:MAG: archease [Candidatus Micrarchaeia archaeon]